MNYGSLVPSFYFYKFAESISQPYTSFAAYRAGAIDDNGNLVKPESSIDPYEYFIIKLKKIFEQLPPGLTKYQLANYTSALNYFAEEAEKFNIEKEHYIALVEGILAAQCGPEASYIQLLEDMSAGGMAVAGDSAGYNTGGVSGFDPVMAPMQRRKPVADNMFHMFDVSENDFSKISNNQMNDIEYLRRFGIRNPDSTLIVRNSKNGNLYTVPKKKKLKEEYNLNFLFEQSEVEQYTDTVNDTGTNVSTLRNNEEGKQKIATGQSFHDAFATHLKTQGYAQISAPQEHHKRDRQAFDTFHKEMPEKSFYVSEDASVSGGHDAFVKVHHELSAPFELKGLGENVSSKKPEITPISVGEGLFKNGKSALERGINLVAKKLKLDVSKINSNLERYRSRSPGSSSSVLSVFKQGLGIPSQEMRNISQSIGGHVDKMLQQGEKIFLIGNKKRGLMALSSSKSRTTSSEQGEEIPHPLYGAHDKILKEIGLHTTGLFGEHVDYARPPRYKPVTKKEKESGKKSSKRIIASLEAVFPEETHPNYKSIKHNAERIFGV